MFRSIFVATLVLGIGFIACSQAPKKPSPGQVWRDPVSGIEFCYCPPGSFQMGTEEGEPYHTTDQKPRHSVTLTRGFWMGRMEVTRAQWMATTESLPTLPKSVEPPAQEAAAESPITLVSWNECQGFLQTLNKKTGKGVYRLPTEAEWEYACKAGKHWLGDYRDDIEHGVAEAQNRPNTWGLIHMLGGAREWCSDWMGRYSPGPTNDPTGPKIGNYRINRGGSDSEKSFRIHPAYRWYYTPEFKDDDLGFRVVRVAD